MSRQFKSAGSKDDSDSRVCTHIGYAHGSVVHASLHKKRSSLQLRLMEFSKVQIFRGSKRFAELATHGNSTLHSTLSLFLHLHLSHYRFCTLSDGGYRHNSAANGFDMTWLCESPAVFPFSVYVCMYVRICVDTHYTSMANQA